MIEEGICMAKAATSTEAMDQMVVSITAFMTKQQELSMDLKKQYITVGEEWDDPKYTQLGDVINDGIAALSQSYAILSNCQAKIQVLKRALEEYLQIRLS